MKSAIRALVAVPAPVISSGIAATLHRLPDMQITASEVNTYRELVDRCTRTDSRLVFVAPSFGGIFNPVEFRKEVPEDVILVAVEIAPAPRHTQSLFDATISVMDDIGAISGKLHSLLDKTEEGVHDNKDQLSQREKEIVAHVVKGLTNKEIAERLFISVHTVITHRRNIARKLEIHSATGLTIYAIVNHLVDLADIRL